MKRTRVLEEVEEELQQAKVQIAELAAELKMRTEALQEKEALLQTITGPHFYAVRRANASIDAFHLKLAARMVNFDARCRLSDLLPGRKFTNAEECRKGDNAVALILADIRSQMASSPEAIQPNGRLKHALQSASYYQSGHGGRLYVDFVQRDARPDDAR